MIAAISGPGPMMLMGVRYVLEGGVRKAGSRMRISGQLVDTTTGAHIWADRFASHR